jgi:hypothetical protein
MTCYLSTMNILSTSMFSTRAPTAKKKRSTCLDQPVSELIGQTPTRQGKSKKEEEEAEA